jgi:hypothetical protein
MIKMMLVMVNMKLAFISLMVLMLLIADGDADLLACVDVPTNHDVGTARHNQIRLDDQGSVEESFDLPFITPWEDCLAHFPSRTGAAGGVASNDHEFGANEPCIVDIPIHLRMIIEWR